MLMNLWNTNGFCQNKDNSTMANSMIKEVISTNLSAVFLKKKSLVDNAQVNEFNRIQILTNNIHNKLKNFLLYKKIHNLLSTNDPRHHDLYDAINEVKIHNKIGDHNYILLNNPILITYVPWKPGYSLDPAERQRIIYFLEMAVHRGYNKFILEMVFVDDKEKYLLTYQNGLTLFQGIQNNLLNIMDLMGTAQEILLQYNLITNTIVASITNAQGGFFLMAFIVE
jgi:hypothetical protein